jgi:DNA-binding transcriptional regulator GbsR (MarR family)
MNLRALMDWGIVYKEYKAERREFFTAEKDLDERKNCKRTKQTRNQTCLKVLKEVSSITSDNTAEEKHFVDQTTKLYDFVLKADNVLDKMTEYKDNWLAKLVKNNEIVLTIFLKYY